MVCNLCYEEIVAPYLIVFIPIENKFSHPRSLPKLSYSVRKEQRPGRVLLHLPDGPIQGIEATCNGSVRQRRVHCTGPIATSIT